METRFQALCPGSHSYRFSNTESEYIELVCGSSRHTVLVPTCVTGILVSDAAALAGSQSETAKALSELARTFALIFK